MNRQLMEIASWRIVTELYRKYPDRLSIIETHPGGGVYDCLTIYDKQRSGISADLNRGGSLHLFHDSDHQIDGEIWEKMVQDPDPTAIVEAICRGLGLPLVDRLPLSTPAVLVYRFVSTFLTHATFGLHRWECRSGMCYTSGFGGGVIEKFFTAFPLAQQRLRIPSADDFNGEPAFRFWFVCRNEIPVLCLETTGSVWLRNETTTHDLMKVYKQQSRNIWSTVVSTAGSLMS